MKLNQIIALRDITNQPSWVDQATNIKTAADKCPKCGHSKYHLMPTDYETAKCDKCGKNWKVKNPPKPDNVKAANENVLPTDGVMPSDFELGKKKQKKIKAGDTMPPANLGTSAVRGGDPNLQGSRSDDILKKYRTYTSKDKKGVGLPITGKKTITSGGPGSGRHAEGRQKGIEYFTPNKLTNFGKTFNPLIIKRGSLVKVSWKANPVLLNKLQNLQEVFKNGGKVSPVAVAPLGQGKFGLVDGYHREAALPKSASYLLAYIIPDHVGTFKDMQRLDNKMSDTEATKLWEDEYGKNVQYVKAEYNDQWTEVFVGQQPAPTFHPPSLRNPQRVKIDDPLAGWRKGDSKKSKQKAKADMKDIMQRTKRQDTVPTMYQTTPIAWYPTSTSG